MPRMNPRVAKVYRSTWKDTRGYFAGQKRASAPELVVMRKLPGGGSAEVQSGSRAVRISRSTAKSLASKNPHRPKVAQTTIAHEFAHLHQDAQANSTANRLEGGAEVFARRIAKKKYGLDARSLRSTSYSGAAQKFRRRHGMREAMKGQFNPRT